MVKEFKSPIYSQELIKKVVLRAIKTSPGASARAWGLPRDTVVTWVMAYAEGRIEIDGHKHHWVLPVPAGPWVRGTCRVCLEEKDFRTSDDFRAWRPNKRGMNDNN